MIRVSYDPRADALYIRLRQTKIDESDEVSPGVVVDYDRAGKPVGIEMLDASRLVGGRPHLQVDMALAGAAKH